MLRAILFDFDGVILESAGIKTQAFAEISAPYGDEIAKRFMKYHMTNMGISRQEKFHHLYRDILRVPYTEEEIASLSTKFSLIVHQRIMNCPFVPGAREFLERFHETYDFYIASGTPDEEMKEIAKGRGISKYFRGIYGTPKKKEQIANEIMTERGYERREILFVGDADTDRAAAKACGITFVGRTTPENAGVFDEEKYKIEDIRGLTGICESLSWEGAS